MLEADYHAILRAAMRIPDAPVKEAAEKAGHALFFYQPRQMDSDVWRITSTVSKELRAVISAYLPGQPIPATPGINDANAEVDEFEKWLDHRLEQDEEEGRVSWASGEEIGRERPPNLSRWDDLTTEQAVGSGLVGVVHGRMPRAPDCESGGALGKQQS